MDPPASGQLEFNHTRIDDRGNFIRANIPGRELLRFHFQGKISGGEPHLLTWLVHRGRYTAAISIASISVDRAEQGCTSILPHFPTASQMSLDRRDSDVSLLRGKQWWLVAKSSLKRRQTRGGTGQGVVGVFNPHKVGAPGGRVLSSNTSESCLQVLISPFRLSIGLRMIS